MLEARSIEAPSTIVEARERFIRKADASSLHLNSEVTDLLRSLCQPDAESDPTSPTESQTSVEGAPNYLEALKMIRAAADRMAAMESHLEKVESKAYEITQFARSHVLAANRQVAALRREIEDNEVQIAELNRKLDEAKQQVHASQQWLSLFQEATTEAFSTRMVDGLRNHSESGQLTA
jgi:hypothetical protein